MVGIGTAAGSDEGWYFAHATGFCKEIWIPIFEEIQTERPDADLVAWDSAAHGESASPDPPFDWWAFGDDVLAVVDGRPHSHRIGVGHSLGGAALAMAELTRPGTFDGLVLIEPIIFPPPFGRFQSPLADIALKRRRAFPSQKSALENFASKPAFSRWDQKAAEAYVGGALAERDGEWVLRCAPADEAEVFRGGMAHGAYDRLGEIGVPVLLLAGSQSTTHDLELVDDLRSRFGDASSVIVEEAGHFLPMERPTAVARLINEFAGGLRS